MSERHSQRSTDRRRFAGFLALAVALLLLQVFCIHLHLHAGLGTAHEGEAAAVLHVADSSLHAEHEQEPHELDVTLPAVLKTWQLAKLTLALLAVLLWLAPPPGRRLERRCAGAVATCRLVHHWLPPLRAPPH